MASCATCIRPRLRLGSGTDRDQEFDLFEEYSAELRTVGIRDHCTKLSRSGIAGIR